MAATPWKLPLDCSVGLFAGREKFAALNDGSAFVGQHETEEAIDIAVFGGAGHLRVDFEYGLFDGFAGGRRETALLGTAERGGAEGGAKYEDSHELLLFG